MATVKLDIVTLHQDQRLRRSLFLVGLVLYDHLLTLGVEVKNIWGPRFKRSSAWFLLFRYVTLLSNLTMVAFFLGDLSAEVTFVCTKLSKIENYLLVVQEFFIGCSLSLRVCAMYGFNRKVFISLAIAALTTVGLGAWAVIGPKVVLETSVPGVAFAWEGQLVCDILILGLTLRRACIYHHTVGLGSSSLLRTMFRDGAVYFGMIALANLANIIMLYVMSVSPPSLRIAHQWILQIITAGSLAWVACSISATMISRLMLNLHDAANQQL
ncbi:hypothetical protein B0H13DRAFT_2344646 [Mycena leptocephala]|nr:hypothetical protein B0H13DRAFT_2384581 [Mycena leptocephala]KAJ7882487.1 hypothetical protein B0H13DRAFT_2344646 [Mycena leptocephala]